MLLGHAIRAGKRDPRDPMYQVALKSNTITYRRVGRPSHKLHEQMMEAAWTKMSAVQTPIQEYQGTEAQRNEIIQTAVDRLKPFAKTISEKHRVEWQTYNKTIDEG